VPQLDVHVDEEGGEHVERLRSAGTSKRPSHRSVPRGSGTTVSPRSGCSSRPPRRAARPHARAGASPP
jgi:hypothetical protein